METWEICGKYGEKTGRLIHCFWRMTTCRWFNITEKVILVMHPEELKIPCQSPSAMIQ